MGCGHSKTLAGPPKKTTICKFVAKGCKFGARCIFAHGQEQIGKVRGGSAYMSSSSWRVESPDVLTLGIFNRQAHFVLIDLFVFRSNVNAMLSLIHI